MAKHPVPVPAAVYEGLEAVRQSGYTNMFDRPRVIELAEIMGFYETAAWVQAYRDRYAAGLFAGFMIAEEGGAPCAD